MAQTYAWVMEQEIAEMSRKNEETVRWIMEQQEREARERTVFAMLGLEHKYREMMEQLVDDFEDITEQLKAQEDRRRHRAMFWQREMEKTAAYDELKRREHAAWREEVESYRVAYDRRKAQEAEKERARREQERQRLKAARDEAEKEAWRRYEEGWNALNPTSSSETTTPLTFNTIPWPLVSPPSKLDDITAARVAMFLLSSNHSDGLSRKERMKNALRRWHPDRFGRILARVIDEEKKDVEEGAGIIVRCLNNLMERESRMIAQNKIIRPEHHIIIHGRP
ncbi:hypothetical protein BXZ70DRAFT_688017 [Cristinia sonorae]|uniref:Uncharacterized protein n=1 Tax=Cristinia sonorae TaxID=1940300 RepID=A0A8K0UDS5_9AGAR|nr:hypothetical protein BXZ70DRAFT_688017 [Cristinia sonorae]